MSITRVKPDWALGDKLTSAELDAIEDNITNALDKRAGQTDTLESDVDVTGDLVVYGTVEFNASVDFNDETSFTGQVFVSSTLATEAGGRIELGDDDYPLLATGHTGRTVTRRIAGGLVVGQTAALTSAAAVMVEDIQPTDGTAVDLKFRSAVFGAVSTSTPATASRAVLYSLNPYILDGATITQVVVSVQGNSGHAGLPSLMPFIRVGRHNGSDAALHSAGDGVSDTAANTAAYQAEHSITATCNQNNVVDKATSSYYVAVFNEGGTNALVGLQVLSITVTQTIADLRPG